MQNLTFLNRIKLLYKLKSSAPMALQFSCNDGHAYFIGNYRKKEDIVFLWCSQYLDGRMVGEW